MNTVDVSKTMSQSNERTPRFQLRLVMSGDPRFLSVVRVTISQLASVPGGSEVDALKPTSDSGGALAIDGHR